MRLIRASTRTRAARGWRRPGLWPALAAVYVQILLPFIVAFDLHVAAAGEPALASFPLCHLDGASGAGDAGKSGAPGGSQATACCPFCAVGSASAPYTAPIEPFVPVRLPSIGRPGQAPNVALARYDTAVPYEARGPPLNS